MLGITPQRQATMEARDSSYTSPQDGAVRHQEKRLSKRQDSMVRPWPVF